MKTSGSYPLSTINSTIEQSIWDRLSNSVVDRHCPGRQPLVASPKMEVLDYEPWSFEAAMPTNAG